MREPTIYLDNNSTTRIDHRVADAMSAVFGQRLANPASQHSEGRQSRSAIESARSTIAKKIGCSTQGMHADQVIFTSGGTEANNLAIAGLLEGRAGDLVVSAVEHPSVLGVAAAMTQRGERRVRYLPVDENGQVCLETWNTWLAEHVEARAENRTEGQIALVSLMYANNETGALQPLKQVVETASPHGILVHSDAIQAVGKIPLSFADLKLDAMSVAAHKLHGPVGIGALVTRERLRIHPMFYGGFQQLGIRPGTESVALAVGFARAIEISIDNVGERCQSMTQLRENLESSLLSNSIRPTIIADSGPRLPHTISIAYPGIDRQALQMSLDRRGIACSTGSACASGSAQPSHVLKAMGLPETIVQGAIRLSLSAETTQEEITEAARRINEVVNRFPGVSYG